MPFATPLPRHGSEIAVVNKVARWVLLLSIVGYPLVAPLSLGLGFPNRIVSVPFRGIVLALSVACIASAMVRGLRYRAQPHWLCLLGFWILYLGRIALDAVLNPAALRLPASEYAMFAIGLCLLPGIAVSTRPQALSDAGFSLQVTRAGAIAVVANIATILGSGSALTLLTIASTRFETDTLNPISLSQLGVTILLLTAWVAHRGELRGNRDRLLAMVAASVGVLAIVLGASRGPVLALLVGLVAVAFEGGSARNRAFWRALTLGIPVVAIGLIAGLASETDSGSLYLFTRLREGLFSDDVRSQLIADGTLSILSSPWLGAGVEPLGFYPHNLILESFLVFGIPSGLMFLFAFSAAALRSLRMLALGHPGGWYALLFLQFSVMAQLSGALYDSAAFWVTMFAVLASHPLDETAALAKPDVESR